MRKDVLLLVVLGVGMIVLANWEPEKMPTHFSSSVDPMDYEPTDTFVRNVFLDGNWLGSAGGGGSTVAGALALPYKWYPGLTATVKWERCDRFDKNNPVPDSEACHWLEKKVLVHPYTRSGGTMLQIIEGEDVLIIPTMFGTRHEDYPGPPPPHKDFFERKGITR